MLSLGFSFAGTLATGEKSRCGFLRAQFFLGLVVIAQVKHPIPSRTRPLSTVALMVLRLKAWESKSLPDLEKTERSRTMEYEKAALRGGFFVYWTILTLYPSGAPAVDAYFGVQFHGMSSSIRLIL